MFFDNVGRTIKILSKVLLGVGIGLSFIAWMVLMIFGIEESEASLMFLGVAVLVFGIFGSWVQSLLLYGFGTLIENSDIIADNMTAEEDEFPFNPSR